MNSLYGKFTSKEISTTEKIVNENKLLKLVSENEIIQITELEGNRFLIKLELEDDEHESLYPTIIGICILSESKSLMN
jgi:hypothetical protein